MSEECNCPSCDFNRSLYDGRYDQLGREPKLDRCRCPDDSGSCDYCQALLHDEIDEDGNPTGYGESLIIASKLFGSTMVSIMVGDLTKMPVDVIVNAANNDLWLGGGLARAIRTAGGPGVQKECDAIGPIEVGQAAITYAGKLPCKYVIHQASMSVGEPTTEKSLRDSTKAVLRIVQLNKLISVAFPAIGTGIAGFPVEKCAKIMIGEVINFLQNETCPELVNIQFVLIDAETKKVFDKELEHAYEKSAERV